MLLLLPYQTDATTYYYYYLVIFACVVRFSILRYQANKAIFASLGPPLSRRFRQNC